MLAEALVLQNLMHAWYAQEANEGYDVYVNEPEPLNEGEEKHIISAFVADESGIINRVAGVFARRGVYPQLPVHLDSPMCWCGRADTAQELMSRVGLLAGANIESLAVGLNIDKALFTIVVTGTPSTVVRTVVTLYGLISLLCAR